MYNSYKQAKIKIERGSVRLMGKVGLKPKKYACFTKEQQEAYEKLPAQQRLYVDYRGQGNGRPQAYQMAGYVAKNPAQTAYLLERRNSNIKELIETLQTQKKARELTQVESALNKQIDALATQQGAEKMLEAIEGADGETAKRIKFYRDIINGKVKTKRTTTKLNAMGAVKETKIEEIEDIDAKMRARKELDKLLGLTQLPDLGSLTMGDITINIVDASKKEELEDSRNVVNLDVEDITIIEKEDDKGGG